MSVLAAPRPVVVEASPAARITPLGRPETRPVLICLLLLVSSVAWRKGTYYDGGLDVVVLGKAALGMLAFALAATAPRRGTPWSGLRVGPVPWLATYLGVTVVGAFLAGGGIPTVMLGARVALITATVVLLVRAIPVDVLLSALMSGMLLLAGVASLTGMGSLASEGRLYGGIPPLNANEISLLVGVPVVCLVWRCLERVASAVEVLAIVPLLGVIWLTGTRTGLVALVGAVLVVFVLVHRIPVPAMAIALLLVPAGLAGATLTPVASDYATRGDTASVLTLNSRTVAWDAALHHAETVPAQLFGEGLEVKKIPVSAMYRTEQILDSTWVSAIVQAGWVGTGLLAVMVLLVLVRAFQPRVRALTGAVLVLLVARSFLESGMFDASASFVTLLCFALVAGAQPGPDRPEP